MLLYWIWFAELPDVQLWQKHILLQHFHDPEEIYHAKGDAFFVVPDITDGIIKALSNKDLSKAHTILRACQEKNIHLVSISDTAYPRQLKNTADAPIVLYYKGILPDFDNSPVIAIVGTRKATTYGMNIARRMGAQIASCGGIVISGGASGNDTMALSGALSCNTPVVAVLAGGVDVVYPKPNTALFEQIAKQGCLISHYPPGTPHYRWNFPVRNRVMSAMSDGVLIVEAPQNSGALITADAALEQGRDVFAVPGNIDVPTCAGSNALLQGQARPVFSGWDILKEYTALYPDKVHKAAPPQAVFQEMVLQKQVAETVKLPKKEEKARKISVDKEEKSSYSVIDKPLPPLSEQEQDILSHINRTPRPVDDVISETGLPPQKVLSILTMLAIKGVVENHPGGLISRK